VLQSMERSRQSERAVLAASVRHNLRGALGCGSLHLRARNIETLRCLRLGGYLLVGAAAAQSSAWDVFCYTNNSGRHHSDLEGGECIYSRKRASRTS
jgi:hypothetical protein